MVSWRYSFLRYIWAAAASCLADWLLFLGLIQIIKVHYLPAYMISRIFGGLVSFLLNKYWSFRSLDNSTIFIEGFRFLILYILSYMLSIALIYLLVDILGLSIYWSKLGSDGTCFAVNFIAMKVYVYAASHRTGKVVVKEAG